jgi:hypothetical protein
MPSYPTVSCEEGGPLQVNQYQSNHYILILRTGQVIFGDRFIYHFFVVTPGDVVVTKFIQATEG